MINLLLTLCGVLKISLCVSCALFAAYIINYDYDRDGYTADTAESDGN